MRPGPVVSSAMILQLLIGCDGAMSDDDSSFADDDDVVGDDDDDVGDDDVGDDDLGDDDSAGDDDVDCDVHVPGDSPSIQPAISAATGGETICVYAGTYTENLDLEGKAVRVVGVDGPGLTTVDGGGVDSVVRFTSGETPATRLEGLTITGGKAWQGGGIYISAASPTLTDLHVVGNDADHEGGGMYVSGGGPAMSGLVLEQNTSANGGGGLYANLATVTLEASEISDNGTGEKGGGLYLQDSVVEVRDARFESNHADHYGGAVYQGGGETTWTRVAFQSNVSAGSGAGICAETSAIATLTSVSFIGNDAGHEGGGLNLTTYAAASLERCLFSSNLSGHQGGGVNVVLGATATLRNVRLDDNWCDHKGGAVNVASYSAAELTNVIAAGNTAEHEGGGINVNGSVVSVTNAVLHGNYADHQGGGVMVFDDVSFTATNVIITDNSAGSSGGGIYRSQVGVPSTASIAHCDVWNNLPDDYASMADPTGTFGNLSENPDLLDVSGADPTVWDLHLAVGSSLADSGDAALLDPDGATSDIGAYGGPAAGGYDLDWDGYFEWWRPGAYDPATSPGMDCDDLDAAVGPGSGC